MVAGHCGAWQGERKNGLVEQWARPLFVYREGGRGAGGGGGGGGGGKKCPS